MDESVNTVLSERSQTQKGHTVCDFIYVKCPEQGDRKWVWLSGTGVGEETTMDVDGTSFWGDKTFWN